MVEARYPKIEQERTTIRMIVEGLAGHNKSGGHNDIVYAVGLSDSINDLEERHVEHEMHMQSRYRTGSSSAPTLVSFNDRPGRVRRHGSRGGHRGRGYLYLHEDLRRNIAETVKVELAAA